MTEEFISQFTANEIESRLKDVTSKAGYFYHDTVNNKYLVFTDENTKDIYLDTQNPNLIIGELAISEKEPETYAEIYLEVPMYNVIAFNSENNRLSFTFDIKNKQGNSTGEEVIVKYNITNGNYNTEITETKFFGQQAVLILDKYLREGTNTISITITSKISKATTSVSVVYNAISITLADHLDISKVYDLSNGKKDYLEISYDVSGSHTKIMEWYLDGTQLEFNRSDDEILETVPISRTKTIELFNLSHGRHNIQFRVGTKVNGQTFYSDTLYRDFFVYTGINDDHIMLGVAITLPSSYGVVSSENSLIIPNMVQYISYDLRIASYSPINIAKTEVSIVLDQETIGTISSSNNKVTTVPIIPISSGSKTLSLIATEVELESQIVYTIPVNIATTNMNLTEITSGLKLDFTASGRNNNSTNRAEWNQGDITGTLTGFKWNNTSGWVNNRLEIDNGSELYIEYAPLANHDNGKTIEIEWMSKNVSNENAILCDLTNDEGTGILITASSVIVTSKGKEQLEEKYKSDENVRLGIVINPSDRGTNKGLTFIYTNGVVSRSTNVIGGDNYISDKKIVFKGTSEASISLKSIKVFDTALTSDQMLNNFNLYRDTVSEMYEIYDRNDIYEGNQISPTKMASRLPVMIITGDIPILENTNDKDTQIVVDIEYINMQDTSRSFIMKNAAMRPQGTSSMGYPKKNFRIYTKKIEDTILEVDGKIVKDKLYSFKNGAIPVDCWCLKADYAEASGTHNTGIAKLWGNAFKNARVTCDLGEGNPHSVNEATVLRTRAQQCAIDNNYPYDVRTTIDGFPILVFYRRSINDDIIFIGKYNFNNDKSTELVFGFEDIPGFDNSRMQCWEVLNNGNSIGLFTDISDFYNNVTNIATGETKQGWKFAFEARYPDKSTNTTDLYTVVSWINGVKDNPTRFAQEKWDHLDVYKVAGYYCYLMRHAGADQFVKNAMFTSEDGEHFYYILYDNDTINGLNNTGDIAILPTDNRESTYVDGSHKFAGYDSVLWNMLEADDEFQVIVRAVDNALYTAGISYGNAIATFDEQQADKWAERVYNLDAEYKYITPYTQNGINNLFMLQGKRELHRRWWLANRFSLYDSLFVSGAYKSGYVEIKCIDQTQPTQTFKVTSGYPIYYGYGINGNLRQRTEAPLQPNQSQVFSITEAVNLGDPIAIYGAPHIKELDLSPMVDRIAVLQLAGIYNNDLGTKLETLIIGAFGKSNTRLQEVSGIKNATALTVLNVTNLQGLTSLDLSNNVYLRKLYAAGTSISSVVLAEGAPIEYLALPSTFKNIDFKSLPVLGFDGIVSFYQNAESIKISDCPNLSNDFNWIYEWYTNKTISNEEAVLHMDSIIWEDVDPDQLAELANIKDLQLKGKVKINRGSDAIINQMRELFGDTVFNKNAEFYIQAPEGVFLTGPAKLLEGESARFIAAVFSEENGRVQFSLTTTRSGCSIDKETGVLTTTENGLATSDITIRAAFISASGSVIAVSHTVTVEKRSYPTAVSIVGNAMMEQYTATYHIEATPSEVTGLYFAEWSISDNEYVAIDFSDNTSCTLKRLKEGVSEFTLSVSLKKNVDSSNVVSTSKALSLIKAGVVITKASNAPLQECLYKNGLVAHEDYSEQWELALITAEQLRPGNSAASSIFNPYRYTLDTFHEFQYFTGVTYIPPQLFGISSTNTLYMYSIREITLPSAITTIGAEAFGYASKLTSITIPASVTSIEQYAFYKCSKLQTTTIKGTPSIASNSFTSCTGTLILENANLNKNSFSNSNFDKLYLGDNVDVVSCEFSSKLTEVHVDNLERWLNISFSTSACNPLFNGAKLYVNEEYIDSVTIPDHLTELKPYVFSGCTQLKSLVIGSGVATISPTALQGTNIEVLSVSKSNKKYDSRDNCNSIIETDSNTLIYGGVSGNIPNSVTSISSTAFTGRNVVSVTIPSGVTSIEYDTFLGLQYLEKVLFSTDSLLTSVGSSAFRNCSSLKTVSLPENSTFNIGDYAFSSCSSLASINIPDGVTEIGTSAFSYCTELTTVNFSESSQLNNLEDNAFQGCSNLTSIIIPNDVTHIGYGAFWGCSSLTEINIPENVTSIESDVISNCKSIERITINCANVGSWFKGTVIKEIILGTSVKSIGDYAFESCSNLTSVTIPESVTSIGNYTFRSCSSLTTVTIPENSQLTSIGKYAFKDCSSLTTITIPKGVTSIGGWTFYNCVGLTAVYISDIEAWFKIRFGDDKANPLLYAGNLYLNGTLVTEITLPSNLSSLYNDALNGCTSMTTFIIPADAIVTTIPDMFLRGCINLKTIKSFKLEAITTRSTTFGDGTNSYVGRNTYNTGENILYVPQGATGYDTSYWLDPLQNAEKCGFTLKYLPDPTLEMGTWIKIDQTISDPATMISGDVNGEHIQMIRNNSHRYLGKYTADGTMTVCQLDDNDSNKYTDGTASVLTGEEGDVFMKMPNFYYRSVEESADVWKIGFYCGNEAPNSKWIKWDTNALIGVYEAYSVDSRVYSRSGVQSSGNISQRYFKEYAQSRGTGFQIVDWQMHCVMAILFYAQYGHTNCQDKVGLGTAVYSKICGQTNSNGMNDTKGSSPVSGLNDAGADGDSQSINFWGLENWWGNKYEWIGNVVVDALEWKITEPDGTVRTPGKMKGSTSQYTAKMMFGNNCDLIPIAAGGSETTGFCDGIGCETYSSGCVAMRSCHYSWKESGVAFVDTRQDSLSLSSSYGSRLAFRGQCIEAESVEQFKSLTAIE